jgi:hypothetical protein
MTLATLRHALCTSLLPLWIISPLSIAHAQLAKPTTPRRSISNADSNARSNESARYKKQRSEWFLRGRTLRGKSSAQLRHRAYQTKMRTRAARSSHPFGIPANSQSSSAWIPLGPVPLASDSTGNGFQDYHQVSGRSTSIAIDPADPSGNTVFIGGAQGGV